MLFGSRAVCLALLPFFLGILFPVFLHEARSQEHDAELPLSGIHYPGGFDPNTVAEIEGRASGFFKPPNGPIQFQLGTEKATYIVIATPPWYWNSLGISVMNGAKVRVRGSKSMGKDERLYMIAQKMLVLSSGEIYTFRDEEGFPLWKGRRRMPR